MDKDRQKRIIKVLSTRWNKSHAEEAGISLSDKPAPLFQLLVAATLFSARIGAAQATRATAALFVQRLTTPKKMCATPWEERVRILNENGYARYDESTARMLGESAVLLQEEYTGDLRKLRQRANCDRDREAELLQAFKGIGKVGAGIFLREVQAVWDEVYPFLDERGQRGAKSLGLPHTARTLAGIVSGPRQMAQLASSLVRVQLLGDKERKSLLSSTHDFSTA